MEEWCEARFRMRERDTDLWREVRAGTTMFLTMSYILLVNPHIMGRPYTGLEATDVVVGTAAASAFASFLVGWFANLPFGMAPGLGLSAYLSFGMVKGSGLPWEGALTTSFASGALIALLGASNLADAVMRWIPTNIKVATVIGMGLLISFIGMQSIGLVVAAGDDSLVKLGPMNNVNVWISLGGLMLLATLSHHRITGGVALGIMLVTLVVWAMNGSWPSSFAQLPRESGPTWEYATRFGLLLGDLGSYVPGIGAFLMVGIFDVSGVMFGLAVLGGLDREDADGNVVVPGSRWVFISAGLGTMLAALLGCSPIICQLESAAGIKEGGRTGLSAIVVSAWFTLSLFFAPLLGAIPQEATAPVVILIGASMMGQASEIDWTRMRVAVPAFLTLAMMPFSFSIPNGIAFGLGADIILYLTCGSCFGLAKTDEELSRHSSVLRAGTGAPVSASAVSYGATDRSPVYRPVKEEGGIFRSPSTEAFMRSPNLILRTAEYRNQ